MDDDSTTPDRPSAAGPGLGLIEALLALAGAVGGLVSGDPTWAAAGFGLAAAVLASRLGALPGAGPRRLAIVLWAAVAVAIVLLLAGLPAGAAIVTVSALVTATLVVVRASR